jgi:GT2 family glycosyltransferase
MKELSIIIVNWNTEALLQRCLESIYKYTENIDYEVIVVDNGSCDNSVKMVQERFPQVILIENNENYGFSRANNIAFKRSSGSSVLFLNSDTELIDNSVKILHDFLNSDSKIGVCGGRLLYPDHREQLSYGYFSNFRRAVWNTICGVFKISRWKKPIGVVAENTIYPFQVDYVVGANLMIKRSVLNIVGLFDENFFAYFEDTDLCFRIKEANFQVWFTPKSKIIHVFGGSFGQFNEKKFKIFTKSQFMYYKKHLGWYIHLKYYFILNYFIKMILFYAKDKNKHSDYLLMIKVLWNTSI